MDEPRYVIIHGHFYQPPRESPWTGLVGVEPGAAPFANWNERILSECYSANAHAQMMDGHIVHIRNNYESLDFNFGPTLAAWLENHGKVAYRAIRRADEMSVTNHDWHGNAIAQSYNHSILPLLTARDREIQVAWGVEDFVYRFGRRPEGIWLPECAVDADTLATVAHAGLRFVILGGDQGRFLNDHTALREAGPFLWRRDGLEVAIFRFDRELAERISFGDLLSDGARLAEAIAGAAFQLPPGAALVIATDGETFGHHKRTGAAELARALAALAEREGLVVTNCAAYLATHPAKGRFEIGAPSSWSCPHGVERWRSNCWCHFDQATNQEWRAPLRGAMEFVTNHTASVYERFATPLVADAHDALKAAGRLFADQSPEVAEEFFKRYKLKDEAAEERLARLFEMERAAQATLTSCAWFFDDFGGPEGRVVLRWAARAVELAAEFAPSIEHELLGRLREIHSNRREIGDAASLYLSLKTREARGRV